MRTSLAAAALALAAAAPAAASPTVDVPDVRRHVTGAATVHVLATNRAVYRVTMNVSAVNADSTTPYSWLEVRVAKCAKGSCATPVVYFTPLAPATYQAGDVKNVSVKLSAFGKPLTVTWTGPGPASDQDTAIEAAANEVRISSSSWPAVAKVSFLGVTCTDAKGTATRHTSLYPTGFTEPTGMMALPAKAPAGQPTAARSCRSGPA